MLGFLQGFAYGLLVSCMPWLLAGLWNPRIAVATEPAYRWQVLLRYWLVIPFLGVLLWLTSLWGGLGPTLPGWLAGLAAVAVALPIERRWRRWRAKRRAQRASLAAASVAADRGESGLYTLDPQRPPEPADEVASGLCAVKARLQSLQRADLAREVDRLYTRYRRVGSVLSATFDKRELAYARSRKLVTEVCLSGVDRLSRIAALQAGVAGVDADYVRRRLADDGDSLVREEREALNSRLTMVEDTERQLRALLASNEETLTALDHAAVALSRVRTERPEASVGAGEAIEELRRFAEGAGRYARGAGADETLRGDRSA